MDGDTPLLVGDARRLARQDVGAHAWARQLAASVLEAADDDLGTFVVARAVLTQATTLRAAELAGQVAAREERERAGRQRKRDEAMAALMRLRAEADAYAAQIRLSGEAELFIRWFATAMSFTWLGVCAFWVFGNSAALDWPVLAVSGVGFALVFLIRARRLRCRKDEYDRANRGFEEVRSRYREMLIRNHALLDGAQHRDAPELDLVLPRAPHRLRWTSIIWTSLWALAFVLTMGTGLWHTSVAGSSFACAVTRVGGVKCWGDNEYGQLGDRSTIDRPFAVPAAGLDEGVKAVSVGSTHACALTEDGRVFCWGNNGSGQVGDGTTIARSEPVEILTLGAGVKSIAAGGSHTCAVTRKGRVECWGANYWGQLGRKGAEESSSPVIVRGIDGKELRGVSAVATGHSHTCALTTTGAVECWGDEDVLESRMTPPREGSKAIAAGDTHSCAVTEKNIVCWGSDYVYGQLGNGPFGDSAEPQRVEGLGAAGFSAIASSGYYTCALNGGGSVACWGSNSNEVAMNEPARWLPELGEGVRQIVINGNYTCAVTATWSVQCWGAEARFPKILNFST